MARLLTKICTVLLGIGIFALESESAEARMEQVLTYSKSQSFNTALRFLRVEKSFNVTEKDLDSGYLMFEYPTEQKKTIHGSIEVIERADEVAVVVSIPQLPSYHERVLIDGLLKKLREDYGAPPAARRPAPPVESAPKEDEKRPEGDDKKAPSQPNPPPQP